MDRDGTHLGKQILNDSQGMKVMLIQVWLEREKGASCSAPNPHQEGLDPAASGFGIWRAQIPQFGAGDTAGGWDGEGGVEFVTSQGLVAGFNS